MVPAALTAMIGVDARICCAGLAADVVDVALLELVVQCPGFIRAEQHAALGILRRHGRSQRLKIPRRRALAYHDDCRGAARQRVSDVGAPRGGEIDARSDVRIEIPRMRARRVAVDLLGGVPARRRSSRDDLGVVVRDAVGVHHLGEALHARMS